MMKNESAGNGDRKIIVQQGNYVEIVEGNYIEGDYHNVDLEPVKKDLGEIKFSLQHPNLPYVLNNLSSSDHRKRTESAIWLGENPHKTSVPKLIKALEEEKDPLTMGEIILALGKIGNKEARQKIINYEQKIKKKTDPKSMFAQIAIEKALLLIENYK